MRPPPPTRHGPDVIMAAPFTADLRERALGAAVLRGAVDPVMIGGLDIGATRAEVVSNTRGLIAVADARTRMKGRGSDG
jgi:hypothetical protein